MIFIQSIYDVISLFTHFIAIDVIYKGISGQIIYPVGLFGTLFIERILKYVTTNSPYLPFKRPDGACDCNIMNGGGLVETASGFPSGHVATTSVYMSLLYFHSGKQSFMVFCLYHIPTILMGLARYMKKCHNMLQIVYGLGLGVFMATILYNQLKLHKKQRSLYKEQKI
jgi:membrane-associated phospholipid phosphatase